MQKSKQKNAKIFEQITQECLTRGNNNARNVNESKSETIKFANARCL